MKVKGIVITRAACLLAISKLSENTCSKFVLEHDGLFYAPKQIVSLASGLPVSGFSGGSTLNNGLTRLGFVVGPINDLMKGSNNES